MEYCVEHGGSYWLMQEGCAVSAVHDRIGRRDGCIAHSGGHRCMEQGCGKLVVSGQQFCSRHGPQCSVDNCELSDYLVSSVRGCCPPPFPPPVYLMFAQIGNANDMKGRV